jgi:hypothetical protein
MRLQRLINIAHNDIDTRKYPASTYTPREAKKEPKEAKQKLEFGRNEAIPYLTLPFYCSGHNDKAQPPNMFICHL